MPTLFASLITLYAIAFSVLAWRHFRAAIIIFLISLPTYLIRFDVFGRVSLPSTLLELSFGIIFLAWCIRFARTDWPALTTFFKTNRLFTISLVFFFVASFVSIFTSDMWRSSLGQWRAYFLEPIIFFIIVIGRRIESKDVTVGLILSTLSVSLVALLQKISPIFYPPSLWDDQLFGRVTSFFTSPNDVGLYLAPLCPLALYFILNKKITEPWLWRSSLLALVMSLGAIIFSRSLGAWIALFVGALILLWLTTYKKSAIALLTLAAIIFFLPPTQSLLATKNKSSANRIILWHYSMDYLTASPKNFVLGTGIRQFFRKIQKPFYNPKQMERLIYPHNIFLNFWTEIGLFGMLGFIGIFIAALSHAGQTDATNRLLGACLFVSLVIFTIHGMVDVPYFKNDLAFLFFALVCGAITSSRSSSHQA